MSLRTGQGRFRANYRPRYCFLNERLPHEELKLKPGQNVLDFIEDYFKDSGTVCDTDLGSPAPLHSSTPNTSKSKCDSKQKLVLSEVVKSTRQIKSDKLPIQPSTGLPEIKSDAGWLPCTSQDNIALSAFAVSGDKLNKKSVVKDDERYNKISSVDVHEEDDDVGSPILLMETEEERPPVQLKDKTTKPYKKYPVENSVMHEPSSPTVQLQIRKRLDFSAHAIPFSNAVESKTEKHKGNKEYRNTSINMQKEPDNIGLPSVGKVNKSVSPILHVQSARENQNGYSKEANLFPGEPLQDLEDEFIISEAHSSDFKSWLRIPKKHKSVSKNNYSKETNFPPREPLQDLEDEFIISEAHSSESWTGIPKKHKGMTKNRTNVELQPAGEGASHAAEQKNSRKLNLKGTPIGPVVEQSKNQQTSKIEEKLHIKAVKSQCSDGPLKNSGAVENGVLVVACEQNCDKSKKQAKAKMTPVEQVKTQPTKKETEEKLHNEVFSNSSCSPSRSSSKAQQKKDDYQLRLHLEEQKDKKQGRKRKKCKDSVPPVTPKKRNVAKPNTEELCSQLEPAKDCSNTAESGSSVENEPQNNALEGAVYISQCNRRSKPPSCWWLVSHRENKVDIPELEYSNQLPKQSLKERSKTKDQHKYISSKKQASKTFKNAQQKQPRLEESAGVVKVSSSKANRVNLSGSPSLRGQNKMVEVDDKINSSEMSQCVSNIVISSTEKKQMRKQKIAHTLPEEEVDQNPEKRKEILETINQKWLVPEEHSKSILDSDQEKDLNDKFYLTKKRASRVSLQHMLIKDGNVPLPSKFRQSLASFRTAYDKTPVTVKRTSETENKNGKTPKANFCLSQRTPVKSSGCTVNDNSLLQAQVRASGVRGKLDCNSEEVTHSCAKESEHDERQRTEGIQKGIDHHTPPLNVTWTIGHSGEQGVEELQEGIDCCTSPLNDSFNVSNEELIHSPDSGPCVTRTRPVDAELLLKQCQSTSVLPSDTPKFRRSKRTRVKPMEYWRGERVNYVQRLSDSDNEDLENKRKQLEKLVLPSNTPNVRRSKRTRVKPMEYWRGERVNYKQRPSGGFIVKDIIPAKELIHKKISKQKCLIEKTADQKTIENVYDPISSPSDPAIVIDPVTLKTTLLECVKTAENCSFHFPFELIAVSKCFNLPTFSSGSLVLGPLKEKSLQFVCLDTIVYYIVHGRLLVTLHCTNYKLKAGDHFFIPPGNVYNIRNLQKEEALLVYTQIKSELCVPENSQ